MIALIREVVEIAVSWVLIGILLIGIVVHEAAILVADLVLRRRRGRDQIRQLEAEWLEQAREAMR